jgi:hypothetical protein
MQMSKGCLNVARVVDQDQAIRRQCFSCKELKPTQSIGLDPCGYCICTQCFGNMPSHRIQEGRRQVEMKKVSCVCHETHVMSVSTSADRTYGIEIGRMLIRCAYADCAATYLIRADGTGDHEHRAKSCKMVPQPCTRTFCTAVVPRGSMQHHLDHECRFTPWTCPCCGVERVGQGAKDHAESIYKTEAGQQVCESMMFCPNRCAYGKHKQPSRERIAMFEKNWIDPKSNELDHSDRSKSHIYVTNVSKFKIADHLRNECPCRKTKCFMCNRMVLEHQFMKHCFDTPRYKREHFEYIMKLHHTNRSAPLHPFGPQYQRIARDVFRLSEHSTLSKESYKNRIDVGHPLVKSVWIRKNRIVADKEDLELCAEITFHSADDMHETIWVGVMARLCKEPSSKTLDVLKGADVDPDPFSSMKSPFTRFQVEENNLKQIVPLFPFSAFEHGQIDPRYQMRDGSVFVLFELYLLHEESRDPDVVASDAEEEEEEEQDPNHDARTLLSAPASYLSESEHHMDEE